MPKLFRAAAAVSVLLIASVAANAADLRMPVKAPAPPPPFSWTGFYIGGNLGGKWGDPSTTINVAPATAFGAALSAGGELSLGSATGNAFMGGGQVGYNWQSGPVVFGVEGDIDLHHWTTTQVLTSFAVGTVFVPGDFFTTDSHWQASLRGRLGYAWDRYLLYATGGVAWTSVTVGANFTPFAGAPGTFGSDSGVLAGGTVGGGLEYALWDHVSLGIEGRYTRYGTHSFNGGTVALGVGPFTFPAVTQSVQLNTVEVIERINWRF
jgi:outer membrane immunogenic protein